MNLTRLTLLRLERTEGGIFGVLMMEGKVLCCTCENAAKAIPTGTFNCIHRAQSVKAEGFTLEIIVDGRTDILVHIGNWPHESEGCVLVGESIGTLLDKRAVYHSRNTMSAIRETIAPKGIPSITVITVIEVSV